MKANEEHLHENKTNDTARGVQKDTDGQHCKCKLKISQGKKFCEGYKHQPRTNVWHTFETKNPFKALEVEDEVEESPNSLKQHGRTCTDEKVLVVKHRWNKSNTSGKKSINTLIEIVPAGVNAMEEIPEWEELEMAVDSGATETVVGEDMIKGIETKPGEGARRGVQYEVASGELIPNLGEKNFVAYGEQGQARTIKAQVCEVNKPLLSVSRMVHAGNTVVFSRSGSYVEDENTGERISLREQG